MFNSPPAGRTRGKTADKKARSRRSLSLDFDPTESKQTSAMAPPPPSASSKVDSKCIEECVRKFISSDSVVDALVLKLADHIRSAVQDAVSSALKPLTEEFNKLKNQVTDLVDTVRVLDQELKNKTDELQQYQRRNNIRVFGVPETPGEDTDRLIVSLCKEKLGVDVPVDAICRSHRLGVKQKPSPDGGPRHRPIIVRFVSYRDRRRVFEQKKKLKGTGLVIREDLTAARLEVFRRAAAIHGGRNTWTMDGRVVWIDGDGKRGSATRLEDLTVTGT